MCSGLCEFLIDLAEGLCSAGVARRHPKNPRIVAPGYERSSCHIGERLRPSHSPFISSPTSPCRVGSAAASRPFRPLTSLFIMTFMMQHDPGAPNLPAAAQASVDGHPHPLLPPLSNPEKPVPRSDRLAEYREHSAPSTFKHLPLPLFL